MARSIEQFVEEVLNALTLRHNGTHPSQFAHLVPAIRAAHKKEERVTDQELKDLLEGIELQQLTMVSAAGKMMQEKTTELQLKYPQLTELGMASFDKAPDDE